jgi:hypothetical protein
MDLELDQGGGGVGYGIRLEPPFGYGIGGNWKWTHGLIPNSFENYNQFNFFFEKSSFNFRVYFLFYF